MAAVDSPTCYRPLARRRAEEEEDSGNMHEIRAALIEAHTEAAALEGALLGALSTLAEELGAVRWALVRGTTIRASSVEDWDELDDEERAVVGEAARLEGGSGRWRSRKSAGCYWRIKGLDDGLALLVLLSIGDRPPAVGG